MLNFLKLFGFTSAGDPKGLRVNASDQLQIEVANAASFPSGGGGTPIVVDPQYLPSTEGLLWDPGTTSADIYEVSVLLVNSGSTPETVIVGIDVDAGGSLAASEHIISSEELAGNSDSGWRGPFQITGDDTIRGDTDTATTVAVHIKVSQLV